MTSEDDLWKTRDDRRRRAREAAATAPPQRFDELRQLYGKSDARARRAGSHSARWDGNRDAVSMPIQAETGPSHFMSGPDRDWLFPIGAGLNRDGAAGSLPRQLAQGGWIYLRAEARLVARARFLDAVWRDVRIEHIPSEDGLNHDAGPGWSLVVDPDSWETVDVPLESESEMGNGYRYYQLVDGRPVYSPVG